MEKEPYTIFMVIFFNNLFLVLPPLPLNREGGGGGIGGDIIINLIFIFCCFLGCVYHGCLDCFQQGRYEVKLPSTNQTLDELFKMTKKREHELKELGYNLVVIWEH